MDERELLSIQAVLGGVACIHTYIHMHCTTLRVILFTQESRPRQLPFHPLNESLFKTSRFNRITTVTDSSKQSLCRRTDQSSRPLRCDVGSAGTLLSLFRGYNPACRIKQSCWFCRCFRFSMSLIVVRVGSHPFHPFLEIKV